MAGGGVLVPATTAEPITVTITNAASGAAPTVYTDQTLVTTRSLPLTITAATQFWVANDGTYTVSCLADGYEVATSGGAAASVELAGGRQATVNLALPQTTFEDRRVDALGGPAEMGLSAWNFDPRGNLSTANAFAPSAGTAFGMKLTTRAGFLCGNIYVALDTVGVALVNAFFAIYKDTASANIGITADSSTPLTGTAGMKALAVTTPVTLAPDTDYYVIGWIGTITTTSPKLGAGRQLAGYGNGALTGNSSRFYTAANGGSLTTTAPATLGTLTAASNNLWIGLGV